jgi:hypothetical protein
MEILALNLHKLYQHCRPAFSSLWHDINSHHRYVLILCSSESCHHLLFAHCCPQVVCTMDYLLPFLRSRYITPTFLQRVTSAEAGQTMESLLQRLLSTGLGHDPPAPRYANAPPGEACSLLPKVKGVYAEYKVMTEIVV